MIPENPEAFVVACATGEAWRREALAAVASLGLPDCWIAAGFVRSPVWDRLHGLARPTPLGDIDVVYFDPNRASDPAEDEALERELGRLASLRNGAPWQVRNQARMHARNGDAPYRSTADALTHWLETPTAVAIRQEGSGYGLLAPFGLDDLLAMTLRPTPHARASARRLADYRKRVASKPWLEAWPRLRLVTA